MKTKCLTLLALCLCVFTAVAQSNIQPRMRVILDNDYAGDPDGLFQLVHHVLSPSVEIRGIIGSHLRPGDGFDSSDQTATHAVNNVNEVLKLMKLQDKFTVYQGSNTALTDAKTAINSEGAKAIVKEAMRTDVTTPLYVVCGGGLTEIASAYLLEPQIADKLTLIWIGGPEYTDIAMPPPGYTPLEYNTNIDIKAVQVIFNQSNIPLWQVPRNAYRETLMAYSELLTKVKPQGSIGKYLSEKIDRVVELTNQYKIYTGETYIMGDSPLVLLTALQSAFEADPSSSFYAVKQAPKVNDAGLYEVNHSGRNIRVYHHLDNRLMFDDFYAKLQLFNKK
ncbi:twin-arginine translocation pathway signal protein [Flavobacterium akiainvivens]|uniref:Twin-arginine translocation pathway signal protein n=1 Tax=Flavobacterium akiainvivens TaxID=1202724 RepID=A0A0M9VHH8_9FLAO|nr:nucleoside hydrolase [Flavobacterium akiainvivens]KOS05576.1 twin-arginine translocation pathway signal protein [Flavobacterium akiainvivens]SFQ34631.1 Inosine-uridine nucleoside N-ribohydrolase [Flavobacterium akiainvivens]